MHNLVNINIKFSALLFGLLLFLYAGAISTILSLNLAWHFQLLVISFCLLSFIYHWRKHIRRTASNAIVALWPNEVDKSQWNLLQRNGTTLSAKLCGDSINTNFILILRFKLNWIRSIPVIICNDAISDDDFRRLRVWLRSFQS